MSFIKRDTRNDGQLLLACILSRIFSRDDRIANIRLEGERFHQFRSSTWAKDREKEKEREKERERERERWDDFYQVPLLPQKFQRDSASFWFRAIRAEDTRPKIRGRNKQIRTSVALATYYSLRSP